MIDFTKELTIADTFTKVHEKSVEVLNESQLPSGGTVASLKGTRYFGNVYPRDHAYATRAFIVLKDKTRAEKALSFMLNCPTSENSVLFQRYNEKGENNSYKPPQIDGNAQTLISLYEYYREFQDKAFVVSHKESVEKFLLGLTSHLIDFPKGSLLETINGIIEFSPFEKGFELYTNACAYRAFVDTSLLMKEVYENEEKASDLQAKAEKVKTGIASYLYFPEHGGFMMCVRTEPDASFVPSANLKSFLALSDFEVFEVTDPRMTLSLKTHLDGTYNPELVGYNRYSAEIGRHNFGNGPWPMVMLRLAHYYQKSAEHLKSQQVLSWVLSVASQNEDVPFGLPEHVSSKLSFDSEYSAFLTMDDISPRPAKTTEYETIRTSKMYATHEVAYPINPLVWSHAMFLITEKHLLPQS